jgi:hypothetical protein
VSVANRPEGTYFIRCYIQALGSSDTNDSTTFVITHTITVSTPSISYTPYLLDQTGYTATCSYTAHGTLDNIEATIYNYTIYDDGTGLAVDTGYLTWTGTEWQRLNLAVNHLPEGTYYVRGTFADSDAGPVTGGMSSTFTIDHTITVSTPTISYGSATMTLDISGVTATCSYTAHGALDNIEATTHSYTVYDSATDTATAVTGNLLYSGGTWSATGIDVSSLSAGTYYVICTFADSDVSATTSTASATFTISDTTPTPTPPIPGFPPLALLIGVVTTLATVLTIRRRKLKHLA